MLMIRYVQFSFGYYTLQRSFRILLHMLNDSILHYSTFITPNILIDKSKCNLVEFINTNNEEHHSVRSNVNTITIYLVCKLGSLQMHLFAINVYGLESPQFLRQVNKPLPIKPFLVTI